MNQTQQGDLRFSDLLQRWLRGDFRRNDERELNSLTEGDDFRREALEGFAALPGEQHEQSLQAIRFRLNAKTQNPAARILDFPRMLAAAAALVLVLAAVWFLPKVWSEKSVASSEIAENQKVMPEPQAMSSGDSISFSATETASEKSKIATDGLSEKAKTAKPFSKNAPQTIAGKTEDSPSQTSDLAAADAPPESKPALAAPAAENAETMQEMESVAVTPSKPSTKIKEYAAPKTSETPSRSAINATKAKPSAKKDADENAKKKHETDAKPDLAKYRKQESQLDESQPLGGWEAFQDYLAGHARLTDSARQSKFTSASVIVQFSLDDKGEPENFRFKKRFGYGLDQEAVRLIKDFNWVPGKSRELEVEVPFLR